MNFVSFLKGKLKLKQSKSFWHNIVVNSEI